MEIAASGAQSQDPLHGSPAVKIVYLLFSRWLPGRRYPEPQHRVTLWH